MFDESVYAHYTNKFNSFVKLNPAKQIRKKGRVQSKSLHKPRTRYSIVTYGVVDTLLRSVVSQNTKLAGITMQFEIVDQTKLRNYACYTRLYDEKRE